VAGAIAAGSLSVSRPSPSRMLTVAPTPTAMTTSAPTAATGSQPLWRRRPARCVGAIATAGPAGKGTSSADASGSVAPRSGGACSAAGAGAGTGRRAGAGSSAGGGTGGSALAATAASSRSASAGPIRATGSRSSSRVTTGSSGPSTSGGVKASMATACTISPIESRWNGDSPWTAVHNIAPSDHRSEAGPAPRPDMRSGAVYSGEPTKAPVSLMVPLSGIRAIPKSVSATRPVSRSISTFAGLTSRCWMSWPWAALSAPATALPILAASRGGSGPPRSSRRASDWPSMSSMTIHRWPRCSTTSCTTTTCGCRMRAALRASRSTRSRRSAV
jgi:hypothetical protein